MEADKKTPILSKTYYKDDYKLILRLKDCRGHDIGWPTFDWTAKIYPASNKANAYTASCVGGVCRNCANDGGRIRIFVDNDRPSPGPVVVEWEGQIPDPEFPDGFRKVALKFSANLTLTSETEVSLAAAEEIPVPAGVLQALTRVAADVDSGKQRMAEALTAQGIPTDSGEPLSEMADKVLDLQLAVEGQPGITDQTLGGVLPTYDLLNELRNHQRADYPYCCGVLFPRVTPSVELKMADAYLCSDGFFTEEQDVAHTLADTDRDLSFVIYYFRERRYTVPTYINPILRAFALNGHPCWALDKLIPDIRSYSEDLDEYESADIIAANNSFEHLTLAGVRVLNQTAYFASGFANLVSLSLPYLEELHCPIHQRFTDGGNVYSLCLPKLRLITGTGLLIFNNASTKSVNLPLLETMEGGNTLFSGLARLSSISLPRLASINGAIITGCAALTELSLPSLTTISGGSVASSCAALTELSLPSLTTISGGSVAGNCDQLNRLTFPSLKTSTRGCLAANNKKLAEVSVPELEKAGETGGEYYLFESMNYLAQNMHVHAPKLKILRCYLYSGNDNTMNGYVYLHLGAIEAGDIYLRYAGGANGSKTLVTVAEGFRSQLRMPNCVNMSADQLRAIIANLGDNTRYPTLPLVFGATNLAKLTEEDIAMATSKNYTLS